MPSGATSATPGSVGLGAGLIYVGTTLWGVSRGGIRAANGQEMRSIEFDGRTGRIVGHDRIVGWDPTVSFDVLEATTANLRRLLPGSTEVTAGGITTITPKKANVLFAGADYLTNFLVAWPKGDLSWFRIRFPKALVTAFEGPNSTDREEPVISATVSAALDFPAVAPDTDTAPFVLETGLTSAIQGV